MIDFKSKRVQYAIIKDYIKVLEREKESATGLEEYQLKKRIAKKKQELKETKENRR